MAAVVAAYGAALSRFPALTKYCTTFWICCASVFMSQRIAGTTNIRRILSYSAVVGAPPYSHYWFILLERMRVGSTASMVLDQVVWRPLTIAWSFIVGAVLADGSLVNLRANLKKDYKKAVLNGLVLWVPLQYINFRYVPMRWRVLFIDVVHFFWDIYMCVLTMESKSASDKKVEDEAAQKLKQ